MWEGEGTLQRHSLVHDDHCAESGLSLYDYLASKANMMKATVGRRPELDGKTGLLKTSYALISRRGEIRSSLLTGQKTPCRRLVESNC